jgi:hypothetical protein
MQKEDDWLSFTAEIAKVDINPCVPVPSNITKTLDKRGFVPVALDLAGTTHLANLVPLGGGGQRLYINGVMLKATGWKVGDRVEIKLRFDPSPRIEPMHQALANAFMQRPNAKQVFDNLNPSRRKEILRYLNNLKSSDAVERTIVKVLDALEGKGSSILVRSK